MVSFSYQELMRESSRMPLFELRKLNASLPVPSVPKFLMEVLVMGAMGDFIVVILMSRTFFFTLMLMYISCVHSGCRNDNFHKFGNLFLYAFLFPVAC